VSVAVVIVIVGVGVGVGVACFHGRSGVQACFMPGKLLAVTLLPDAFPYRVFRQCVRISACTMRQ
jgi:hypothetical protein